MNRKPLIGAITFMITASGIIIGLTGCSQRQGKSVTYSATSPDSAALFESAAEERFESERPIVGGDIYVSADEVWVIVRPEGGIVRDDDTPGCGTIRVRPPGEKKEIDLLLKHTDVKADICGYIATVNVTQQFQNPYDEKIEAVYVFPLPDNAAVNEFVMTIGRRKIRGIIRRREEAERVYKAARRRGYTASLLTQERPNVFTQKVANIEPGRDIDVTIRYSNTLAYVDGWYEIVFPMVVGPRFNPPGSRSGIGAVGRGRGGISGQVVEVQYLPPDERSTHGISLAVDIDAGVDIEELVCPTHVVSKKMHSRRRAEVVLSDRDDVPNRDFVLRYRVAGDRLKSAMVTHRDKRGGYFSLMLYPPAQLEHLTRSPMEMIFVLDCSGSMSGKPLAHAKDAIRRALKKLGPDDTFQVIRFSSKASQLGRKPLPATAANIRKGLHYVDSLNSGGGTMMIEGIKAALDFEHDPRRFRVVSFMTDGYIGNETEILAAIHDKLGDSRIFSFGVGSSVNRYLLDRMAAIGKGAVVYIGPDDSPGEIVDLFYERISHPALTDIEIDWGGMNVKDAYPRRIPDLFVGRPVVVTGRFGRADGDIRIRGRIDGRWRTISVAAADAADADRHEGIACVWARKKIEDLANRAAYSRDYALHEQITATALEYGLMSAYTAFVAVDSSHCTEGDHGVTVTVSVPVPDGVRYETSVQN